MRVHLDIAIKDLAAAGEHAAANGAVSARWDEDGRLEYVALSPGADCEAGWAGLTGPGIQAITSLTVSGSTLAGVGFTASPAGEEPVFWQSPIR